MLKFDGLQVIKNDIISNELLLTNVFMGVRVL